MLRRLLHGFRQQPYYQYDRAQAERGHAEEAGAPAERRLQDAAERGRHDRCERRDRAHAGELAAGAHPLIEVTDNGARQHRCPGNAQGLQAAQGDQHFDRGCEHAAQADGDVERQRGEQHRLAADMVGDRSKHDLADGEAQQVARQSQLHLRHRRAEHPPKLRQRGQIEIDRHRADRGQQSEQRGQRQSVGTQHRALLGCDGGNSYVRCGMMALCRARDHARRDAQSEGLLRCPWRCGGGAARSDADRCRSHRATPWRVRAADRGASPAARTAASG